MYFEMAWRASPDRPDQQHSVALVTALQASNEACLIPANQNRRCETVLQNVLGEIFHSLRVQGFAPLHGNIDVFNLDADFVQDRPPAVAAGSNAPARQPAAKRPDARDDPAQGHRRKRGGPARCGALVHRGEKSVFTLCLRDAGMPLDSTLRCPGQASLPRSVRAQVNAPSHQPPSHMIEQHEAMQVLVERARRLRKRGEST